MYFVPQGWMIVSSGIYMLMRMMKAPNRWYIHPPWQQCFHPRRVLRIESCDDDPAFVVQCREIPSKCEQISGSLQCLSFQILCCTVGGKKWKNLLSTDKISNTQKFEIIRDHNIHNTQKFEIYEITRFTSHKSLQHTSIDSGSLFLLVVIKGGGGQKCHD